MLHHNIFKPQLPSLLRKMLAAPNQAAILDQIKHRIAGNPQAEQYLRRMLDECNLTTDESLMSSSTFVKTLPEHSSSNLRRFPSNTSANSTQKSGNFQIAVIQNLAYFFQI